MGKCINCEKEHTAISKFLGLCRDCVLSDFKGVESHIHKAHQISREAFALPPSPPQDKGGISCNYCFNKCQIGRGEIGYCGVRENTEGKKISPSPKQGFFN